jgi:hypothetical protein
MALGSYGTSSSNGNKFNNNNSNDRTYYSRLNFRNYSADTNSFTLNLSVQFTIGLMKIKVDEREGEGNYKELETIFLSPTKAYMLAEELKKFKTEYLASDKKSTTAMYGINGGMKEVISFLGVFAKGEDIVIRLGKFKADTGEVTSQVDFVMSNTSTADEWENPDNFGQLTLIQYPLAEIDQLIIACEEFARSMNGAMAYSVLDLGRYDINRFSNRFDQIFDKLGIERYSGGSGNGNGGYRSSNFLNNAANNNGMYGNNTSKTKTLDSIEDMFDDEE